MTRPRPMSATNSTASSARRMRSDLSMRDLHDAAAVRARRHQVVLTGVQADAHRAPATGLLQEPEQRRRLVPGDEAGVCRTAGAVGGEEFPAKRRAGVRGVPRLERAQDEMRTEVRDVDLAIAETGGVEVEESDRRIGHQYLLVVE